MTDKKNTAGADSGAVGPMTRTDAAAPRRGRKPDPELREKLLNAAAVAFMERGFSGTSIDDIADVLGVTKGSVYHHYASKSELYLAVQDAAMQYIDALVRPIFETDEPSLDKLRRMAHAHAMALMGNFAASKVGVQGLERSLMSAGGIEARRALRRAIRVRNDYEEMFRSAIGQGIADGSLRDEPVGLMAAGALGALNWITMWFDPKRSTTQAQMTDMARQLAHFVVRGLQR